MAAVECHAGREPAPPLGAVLVEARALGDGRLVSPDPRCACASIAQSAYSLLKIAKHGNLPQ